MRYKGTQLPLVLGENDVLDLGTARVSWQQDSQARRVVVDGTFRLEASLASGERKLFEAGNSVYMIQAGDDVLLVEVA